MTSNQNKGLLNKALSHLEANTDAEILNSIINNIESGFDAPYEVFKFLTNYLDINSGALLFYNDKTQKYYHIASKNLDYNSISRLTINKEYVDNLTKNKMRNYISFDDFNNSNTFLKINFSYNNKEALLLITNARIDNNESYEVIMQNKNLIANKLFSYVVVNKLTRLSVKKAQVSSEVFTNFINKIAEDTSILLNIDFALLTKELKKSFYVVESEIYINLIQLFLNYLTQVIRIGYGNFIFVLNLKIDISEKHIQAHVYEFLNKFTNNSDVVKVRALRYIKNAFDANQVYNKFFLED